jgi:hypothetical protein
VHQFLPLALRWRRPPWHLFTHAAGEVLVIKRKLLDPRDLHYIAWTLLLIADRANRDQVAIVCLVPFDSQAQWRTMIEDHLAQPHPPSAIE